MFIKSYHDYDTMSKIPLLGLKKLCKSQGALRVSDDALKQLQMEVFSYVQKLSQLAKRYAKHANRRTILDSDIQLAIQDLEK